MRGCSFFNNSFYLVYNMYGNSHGRVCRFN
jgi:hypothetical protein